MPGRFTQNKQYPVCQVCGRVTRLEDAAGWLVSPMRTNPDVNVVRCPKHISEWSLRQSQAGRTNAMRQLMRDGQEWDEPIPPALSPFPLTGDH